MDFADFKDHLSRQRAIRVFDTSRDVEDATVEELIRVATFAPNGGNRQPWRFLVIRDPSIKAKLADIYEEQAMAYTGTTTFGTTSWRDTPVLIAVCSESAVERRGQADPSILPAVQNLLLAVHTLGLGSVLTTLWKAREDRVREALNLPENVEIHVILPIGWPTRKYGRSARKPVAEVTFRDSYGKPW